jgi:hypothetical protein
MRRNQKQTKERKIDIDSRDLLTESALALTVEMTMADRLKAALAVILE